MPISSFSDPEHEIVGISFGGGGYVRFMLLVYFRAAVKSYSLLFILYHYIMFVHSNLFTVKYFFDSFVDLNFALITYNVSICVLKGLLEALKKLW